MEMEAVLIGIIEKGACDFDHLKEAWVQSVATDNETKRNGLDNAFRNVITSKAITLDTLPKPNLDHCRILVSLAIEAARAHICSPIVPIVVLADTFDLIPLDQCQLLFPCVEDNVKLWTSDLFFSSIKNTLLRMCNDLLKRLSRAQNTAFYGMIMLFLAKFFPISDRSGLNVISEFNLDNITKYNENADSFEALKDAIVIEEDEKSLDIDYPLYRKFWELQDFFRFPSQCYSKLRWKVFTTYSNDVLSAFKSFKLDSLLGQKSSMKKRMSSPNEYFPKYLTNQNLLQLQLSDSNFRRYILIQYIILFQYLTSTVKFKGDSDVLLDEQSKWIESAIEKVYSLMAEIPPDGIEFASCIKRLVGREEQWNLWKNEGCKPFNVERIHDKKDLIVQRKTKKRRLPLGHEIELAHREKIFIMGNDNLTKLWNLSPDNMHACSAEERDFLPSMESYFSDAIDELNPENQIEDEYKKVFCGSWGWRALRLLAKRSPHFFTYGNNPIARLPDYLEQMMRKMVKEIPLTKDDISMMEATKNGSTNERATCLSSKDLDVLASNIAPYWEKFIPKFGLTKIHLDMIERNHNTNTDRARALLEEWKNIENEEANKEELLYILEGLKLKHLGERILF